MADSEVTFVTFVTAVCLQYIIIGAASILISRKHRRRRQYWVKPLIRMRSVWGAYHSLLQQLLTTDAQSFQNFIRMVGSVADLSIISDLIGWSHRNVRRRFLGVNEHCSFTPVNRPMFCSSGILSAGIFGQGGGALHSTPAVSTCR